MVFLGSFLVIAGICMDVIGSQINSSSGRRSFGMPFNALVLVGRIFIAVGVTLMLLAAFLMIRIRFRKNKSSVYQRASTHHEEGFTESHEPHSTLSPSPPQLDTPRRVALTPLPLGAHIMPYSRDHSAQNIPYYYSHSPQLGEGQRIDNNDHPPFSSTPISRYSLTRGVRNPSRYPRPLETSIDEDAGSEAAVAAALMPTCPFQVGTQTYYPTGGGQVFGYTTTTKTTSPSASPVGQSLYGGGGGGEDLYGRRNRSRTPSSAQEEFDEPPPYESINVPPAYGPLG